MHGRKIPLCGAAAANPVQQRVIANNVWDFAPNIAFTYTTPPIIAEGTEISAKLFWNNYLTNPATQYSTGTVINLDFAMSERIGRFQSGAYDMPEYAASTKLKTLASVIAANSPKAHGSCSHCSKNSNKRHCCIQPAAGPPFL